MKEPFPSICPYKVHLMSTLANTRPPLLGIMLIFATLKCWMISTGRLTTKLLLLDLLILTLFTATRVSLITKSKVISYIQSLIQEHRQSISLLSTSMILLRKFSNSLVVMTMRSFKAMSSQNAMETSQVSTLCSTTGGLRSNQMSM